MKFRSTIATWLIRFSGWLRRFIEEKNLTGGIPIKSESLLLGSLYALEQCGLLVNDAAVLAEQQRFPTAAALALIAREELGRHRRLLQFWRDSMSGTVVTSEQIRKAFTQRGSHETKQSLANMSLQYRWKVGDEMDRLVRARQKATPGTKEWKKANDKLQRIDDARFKAQPSERHQMRMSATYVDLAEDGSWLRPMDLSPQECADEVSTAVDDYQRSKLRLDEAAPIHQDVLLANALAALASRPTLPETPRLSLRAALPENL